MRVASASDRLVGTLVHRLLQRIGFSGHSIDDLTAVASRLVRHDEIDEAADLQPIADAAVAAYTSICARDDIRALYQSGRRLHEVPFTMTRDGRVLRGTVDCLVEAAPRQFTILEFKTGRPRPEHRAQLDLYVQAMKQAFPGTEIDARLIYS